MQSGTVPFLKMHGLGNDFVVIDRRSAPVAMTPAQLTRLADRRRGIGCDQIIFLDKAAHPDVDLRMQIFNADGGEVAACGNATRCVAGLIFDETRRDKCVIETQAGLLSAWRAGAMVAVDFGQPGLSWRHIPLVEDVDTLSIPVVYNGVSGCCVSMGNPHAVFFVDDVTTVDLAKAGPPLEHHPLFPERCNIEFAQIVAPDRIRMRVWERGTGITEACGTGACATHVAAVRRGLSARRATIILDGGELMIEWREDNHVIMTGAATLAYRGFLPQEAA